jgi:DNA polymerase-3 subunit gamma/tau
MSYLVLARKYRPKTFGEVVGQEVVTRVLQGAIAEGRIAHAYLFAGPRGTGKTTTARILAKALNCEKGPAREPCGSCERCRAADERGDADIIEIDAASNRQIDDVRALREEVAYAPMRARFKIYIIDEVHMLTGPAFNALLKTLEEPPAHIKFLFATTDPLKVPETIRSRCQILTLTLLPDELVASHLADLLARENVRFGEGVPEEIARSARGSLRDALTLADQLLSLAGSEPTRADVKRLSSGGDDDKVEEILNRVEQGDRAAMLLALPVSDGSEAQLLERILTSLRESLLAAASGQSPEGRARGRAERLGLDRLQVWLEVSLQARERMRLLPHCTRLILELALLDLCRPQVTEPLSELEGRLLDLEARLGGAGRGAREPAREPVHELARPRGSRPERPPRQDSPESSPESSAAGSGPVLEPVERRRGTSELWNAFLDGLAASHESLSRLLRRRGELEELGGGVARIRVSQLGPKDRILLEDVRNRSACAEALARVAGGPVEVRFEERERTLRQPDAFTARVADLFGGTIEEDR